MKPYALVVGDFIGPFFASTVEPIMDNEHVKELLAVLREHSSPSAKAFLAVLNQVGAMETCGVSTPALLALWRNKGFVCKILTNR